MSYVCHLVTLSFIVFAGQCSGYPTTANQLVQFQDAITPRVLLPIPSASMTPSDYRMRLFRSPRSYLSYRPVATSSPVSYRRYRSVLPTSLDDASGINELQQQQRQDQLRILDWLFGRPSYSRYPDYSPLEMQAGLGPMGMGMRPSMLHRPSPGYVEEECTMVLDPYTHETFEDCVEVPHYGMY